MVGLAAERPNAETINRRSIAFTAHINSRHLDDDDDANSQSVSQSVSQPIVARRSVAIDENYTVSQKTRATKFLSQFHQILADFQIVFTGTVNEKNCNKVIIKCQHTSKPLH